MLLARTALRARPLRGVRARALGDLCTDMVTEDAASKYAQAHARSLADPEGFWSDAAKCVDCRVQV